MDGALAWIFVVWLSNLVIGLAVGVCFRHRPPRDRARPALAALGISIVVFLLFAWGWITYAGFVGIYFAILFGFSGPGVAVVASLASFLLFRGAKDGLLVDQ